MSLLAALSLCSFIAPSFASDEFARTVAPILVERCLGCHNSRVAEGNYSLATMQRMLRSGESDESPVVAGSPDTSELYRRLVTADEGLRMPLEADPLAANEIEAVREWIAAGALVDSKRMDEELNRLVPPRRPPLPPETYSSTLPIFALAYSPDGRWLLSGGRHEVLVWESQSGTLTNRISGMPQRIQGIKWAPDGESFLVYGGVPGVSGEVRRVSRSELEHPTPIDQLPAVGAIEEPAVAIGGWADLVLDVVFFPEGDRWVAGSADNSLRCVELATGETLWSTRQHGDWVTSVAVVDYHFLEERIEGLPEGDAYVATDSEKQSNRHRQRRWDFGAGHAIVRKANWELEVLTDPWTQVQLPSRLTRITETGIGANYRVARETIAADQMHEYAEVVQQLLTIASDRTAIERGERLVIAGSLDRTVKVMNGSDGSPVATYKGHRREYGPLRGMFRVQVVYAQKQTRRIWSAGEGGYLHGWDPIVTKDEDGTAADMEERFAREYSIDLIRHGLQAPIMAWQAHEDRLFAATEQGELRSYRIGGNGVTFGLEEPGNPVVFDSQPDAIYAVAIDPVTGRVATAGFEGVIQVRRIESGERIQSYEGRPGL